MYYRNILVFLGAVFMTLSAHAGGPPQLAFREAGDRLYDFDTGAVKGTLRANGKYQGISSLIDIETGRELTRSAGIFSYYRILSTDKRWGDAARDWPMDATLLPDGSVRIHWPSHEEHPIEMLATYRWTSPTTLDLETVVTPRQDMPAFEVFLSSYFDLAFKAIAYAKPMRPVDAPPAFILADVNPLVEGSYLLFPADQKAAQSFFDLRWQAGNGLIPWALPRVLGAPLAIKRDVASDITILLMSRPEDCFALSMSYNMDPPDNIANHGSVYMSLFGEGIAAGVSKTASVRMVVDRKLTNERAVELQRQFAAEPRDKQAGNAN